MSEATEQKEIVGWFRDVAYPDYAHCLRVSLSGLNFGSGARAARMVNHIRAQGINDGESDILIAIKRGDFGSFVMEYKAGDGDHKASESQIEYIQQHNAVGNCAVICKGVEVAKAAIKQYMELDND